MITRLEGWLATEITLADALPILLLVILTVLAATMATRFRGTTEAQDGPLAPTPLARAEAWLERAGIGPFWRIMFWLTAVAFFGLFLIAIAAAYVLVTNVLTSDDGTASLGLGALLVALLGAPFLIWRTVVAQKTLDTAQRQTDLQAEAHFNDKINAAATDLAARRQVTRVVAPGGSYEKHQDFWEDDLVTRAAAIDRLEGLALEAMEREDYAPAQRIARMLSIYVQELSREYPAKEAPAFQSREQMREWAETLRPVTRPDMERAAQSLGRINPGDKAKRAAFDPTNIDLRRCNLQGFDLNGKNYQGAQIGWAQMQGANLFMAEMQGAVLSGAQMQGAGLFKAEMQGANLSRAWMQGAVLSGAQMHGADLFKAQMQGAVLIETQMSDDTNLTAASLRGAAVRFVDDTTVAQLRPHWDDIIAFLETLPEGAPDHWVRIARDGFNYTAFITQWRAFAATLDPPVTI